MVGNYRERRESQRCCVSGYYRRWCTTDATGDSINGIESINEIGHTYITNGLRFIQQMNLIMETLTESWIENLPHTYFSLECSMFVQILSNVDLIANKRRNSPSKSKWMAFRESLFVDILLALLIEFYVPTQTFSSHNKICHGSAFKLQNACAKGYMAPEPTQ